MIIVFAQVAKPDIFQVFRDIFRQKLGCCNIAHVSRTAGAALRRGDGDPVCVQPGYSQPDEPQ